MQDVQHEGHLLVLLHAGGSIVWHRELSSSGSEIFRHMSTAPFDSRQLCVCGHSGALLVLQLTDPARDKVQVQQYRVNLPGKMQ